ncbi:SMP-30/gluconolactonase/LRE family protein [Geomesophilobacter sediminis]|uniref:Major royal jelly protein n=1 Tax=Geomesophilobacter sediminis TaxID=2798584 RepID=A0A8J7JAG2_9BACT|nr:L-dopachrome tautomerase-related protein [Geomesophilobacter sediminis]MBJ6723876.1 hypothetical protein [Geomesophilobacter sediminis]
MKILGKTALAFSALALFSGCATYPPTTGPVITEKTAALTTVGQFQDQVTGVAVSSAGRIFVNFPRWGEEPRYSVAELLPDGTLRPYPDAEWNRRGTDTRPDSHFVCVQSVYVDADDNLWILDPASPSFSGVVAGGAKLLRVNLDTDQVEQVIRFSDRVAPRQSYLNDVRVDPDTEVAYLTDSGMGALVVVDLETGESRRVLAGDRSTLAEPDVVPVIGGKELRDGAGKVPKINADGIALDPDGKYLYYHALTGKTLYRIGTDYLNDPTLLPEDLALRVEKVAVTRPTDGMEMGSGGTLYWTSLEENAVNYRRPDGSSGTVIASSSILWPDSLAIGPDRYLYFTASQIHLSPRFNGGIDRTVLPYRLFKVWVAPF